MRIQNLVAAWVTLLVACGSPGPSGPNRQDAGRPVASDAGVIETPDASALLPDAGGEAPDAGSAVVDAGSQIPDASTADAGVAVDAGPTGSDGGSPRADAGVGLDASVPFDAGQGTPDASIPCTATDIVGKLACLQPFGVTAREVTVPPPPAGYRRFDLTVTQPVDHMQMNGPTFSQRVVLHHIDEADPVVLFTSGYGLSSNRTEITRAFETNQVSVEHRYFSPSVPATPIDWSKLNILQSANDFHRITVLLKSIYRGKWVNTGASKGGMTSVYHRRFFPADLDGTIPYVAPNVFGTTDARFPPFLTQVGGAQYANCRQRLSAFQTTVLNRRMEMVSRMTGNFTQLGGKEIALEHAVLEMPFAFWQYSNPVSACSRIPDPMASAQDIYSFFSTTTQLQNYSDTQFTYFSPYYYQAATQLGAPAVDDTTILSLLMYRSTYSPATYAPKNVPITFDAAAMVDVQQWVRTNGRTLLFIYGEFDPWTAGKFELGNAADSFSFVAPGANHGARIELLSAADRTQAWATIARWLGVPPPMSLGPVGFLPDEEDDALMRDRPRL